MILNVCGGRIETNGDHTTLLFRTYASVANIYDGTIIAGSTSAQSANMMTIQAQDSTVNIWGGHIETKTTQTATFTVRHNNAAHGKQMGALNIYGGTFKAGKCAVVGAGTSSKDGQVNIYGGTFIKTGAVSTYGLLGHYNNGSYDKNYYIYGGTFITKDTRDPLAYRYAKSSDITSPINCTGVLNRAYDSVRAITVTKATAAQYGIDWAYDGYADVCVITPKGTDLRMDMFGKIGTQIKADTTADSATTSIRVLFEVDEAIANNPAYSNVGFAISVENGNPAENTATNVKTALLKDATVYRCVRAGNDKHYASKGYCFAILTINNVPNASFDTNIYVRPYLIGADGTVYYGRTATVKVLPL
jgi:hypothetical protein